MDQGPLVNEQVSAGRKFLDEFQKHFPIQSAFWLKESEGGEWNLYITSDQITDENLDVAYGVVVRIPGIFHDPCFDPFQIKLLAADDPLAIAVAEVRRHPGPVSARMQGSTFGGVSVEAVYFYPSPLPAAVQ